MGLDRSGIMKEGKGLRNKGQKDKTGENRNDMIRLNMFIVLFLITHCIIIFRKIMRTCVAVRS